VISTRVSMKNYLCFPEKLLLPFTLRTEPEGRQNRVPPNPENAPEESRALFAPHPLSIYFLRGACPKRIPPTVSQGPGGSETAFKNQNFITGAANSGPWNASQPLQPSR